ncbi:MAG: ABC transporter ATP-binding protein [Deltaproteobacteria bacterium]|nr:ABC transporter ATP-binding protein [Deltaproteobacteria bacterium]
MKSFRDHQGPFSPSRPKDIQADLDIKGLSLRWGSGFALNNIDLSVRTGEIFALIGPKGAGKTSLIDCITGELTPHQGSIIFNNEDITGREPHYIACLGIGRNFQDIKILPEMTLLPNLLLARTCFYRHNIFSAFFFSSRVRHEENRNRGMVELLIEMFQMQHLRKSPAGKLSYGMSKRLEIARALAMEPGMLILDDPFTGMTQQEMDEIKGILSELNKISNIAIIIAEDDMSDAVEISNRVAVLDFGVKLAEGAPDFVENHPKVTKLYPPKG